MFDAAALVFPLIKQVSIKNWPGVCNDGVNSAGLGMSLQWQLDTPGVPAYNKSQPGPAIDQGGCSAAKLAGPGGMYWRVR